MNATSRSRRESIVTALIWRVFESPTLLRIVLYGSVPVAAFVLATLSGSGFVHALQFAGLQGAIIGGSAVVAIALRRLL